MCGLYNCLAIPDIFVCQDHAHFIDSTLNRRSLKPLAEHFLGDRYRNEINRTNILGYKGQIADEFGLVVKGLWEGTFRYLKPDRFKLVISQCKGDFAGTKQQDAQELLIFLLDGLHEDLNKVKERRYIEEKV